jgi:hypothetical protein
LKDWPARGVILWRRQKAQNDEWKGYGKKDVEEGYNNLSGIWNISLQFLIFVTPPVEEIKEDHPRILQKMK